MRIHARLLFIWMALLLLAGCYSTPVRHLASDAALIKPGQSTVQDMFKYLGEPTKRKDIGPGSVEYIYQAERPGKFEPIPVVGSMMSDPAGQDRIIIRAKNDLIVYCEFRTASARDQSWKEDFTWEEIE